MNNLFDRRDRRDAARTTQIKGWVAQMLELPEDSTVLVSELSCTEPGCPPLETVVAVLMPGVPARQFKVHKPLTDVTLADVTPIIALVNGDPKEVANPIEDTRS